MSIMTALQPAPLKSKQRQAWSRSAFLLQRLHDFTPLPTVLQTMVVSFFSPTTLYLVEFGSHCVRGITMADRTVWTVAGIPFLQGHRDATVKEARLDTPCCVAFDDSSQRLFIGTYSCIRCVTPGAMVSTLCGHPNNSGYREGVGFYALFKRVGGALVFDGHLYVSDTHNHVIRRIPLTGAPQSIVIAGSPGRKGRSNGTSAKTARFYNPRGLAADVAGNLYVADSNNHMVRKVSHDGTVTTLAGTGKPGFKDGPAEFAQFHSPSDVALDWNGDLLVADWLNHCVRVIRAGTCRVGTLAGSGTCGFRDGELKKAQFDRPSGVAIDPSCGDIYIADSRNHVIRCIKKGGSRVTTLSGKPRQNGAQNGIDALFTSPVGLTLM